MGRSSRGGADERGVGRMGGVRVFAGGVGEDVDARGGEGRFDEGTNGTS